MRITYALTLITAVATLAACDNPYNPDAPAIDPAAPVVHITSPARGTFAGAGKTVVVTGTATDDSGAVASVTVNDVAAVVNGDGTFAATVPVTPGTNLLHAVATDAGGNVGKESRAVVAGALTSLDRSIPSALTMSMSAQTFDAIGRGAAGYIQSANLTALVQPMNPVLDLGTTNGQPDCLYAQAIVTSVAVGRSTIGLAPHAGGLELDAVLESVRIGMHLQYAASCVDGSRDVVVAASKVHVAGNLAIGVGFDGFDIKLVNPDVTLTNFNVNLGGVPGAIVDMLSLDTRMAPIIGWATERFVAPMLNKSFASLNQTKTVSVLGHAVDVTVTPAAIDFDVTGAVVQVDTTLRAHGDEQAAGFVFVPNAVPAMNRAQGFQLAVADDAANQLLTSLWAAHGMDAKLDLKTGSYGEIGTLYDRVEIAAAVPPYVDASGSKLVLTIGDLGATFMNGESVATKVVLNAQLALEVNADPTTGALRLDVGTPTTYVDVLDESVDGANELSNAQFESIASFAVSRAVAFGSGAVGAIPLPAAGGVALKDVSVTQQTGYLVVGGRVE